ncbi:response regulator transcription factor [Bacillus sp. Bva_UNVM-123]|uniref:response regulator transcription factor n=1 Tax=Bacillus sp. Bva_UNVM-123 TaxID=2829798 RepID=UPI00391F7A9E
MHSIKIVIVEDDAAISEILSLYLKQEGYTVNLASNVATGLRLIEEIIPDILLLDINLPDGNGFKLAQKYRDISNGILIFITGEKTTSTIIQGFDIGCDDYITKPFDPPEVIARIKANTRRSGLITSDILKIGNLSINFTDKSVYKNGKTVELFIKEKQLLFLLVRNPNQVFSAEQLYDIIWGIDAEADLKTVQVYLSTLRKKIEDNPKNPEYIKTVRGFGYKLSL